MSDDPAYQPKAYTIVTAGQTKIAVIGADTQETPSLTSPTGLKGLTFTDPVEAVNKTAAQLEADKAAGKIDYDLIVAEYHDGAETTPAIGTAPKGGPSFDKIVNETSADVAAIFNGHTHQAYLYQAPVPGLAGATRPIVETGSYGANLGVVTLVKGADGRWAADVDRSKMVATPKSVAADAPCAADATYQAAAKIADDATKIGDQKSQAVVGSLTGDVTTAYDASNASYVNGVWTSNGKATKGDDRGSSSTLSDTVADSMVWATQQPSYGGTRATIGVMNPGGVRADVFYKGTATGGKDGEITYGEANNVLPFVNNLSTVTLTGDQFVQLLNQQWQRDGAGNVPARSYLQLGLSKNVSYTFDASLPEGKRITSVMIDGKPIQADAKYSVVAANFLVSGGDNFHAFAQGTNVTDTGLLDRDAWISYLENHKELTPDYAQRGVQVKVAGKGTQDAPCALTVSGLESHSLGAPQITEVTATIAGKTVTAPYTVDASTGRGTATLTLPTGLKGGPTAVTLTAKPDTGTKATVMVDMPATAPTSRFSDVKPGTMYYAEIEWMAAQGITKGYPDGTFRPLANVNRDAMAEYLYRMAGSPKVTAPRTQPFTDVKPGMEHYDAIIWASQQGITTGWLQKDGTRVFKPTAPITRDAMAVFLYRCAGSPAVAQPTAPVFKDVPASRIYAKEIAWMKAQKISTGWADGTFRPLTPIHRDAMAAFVYRMEHKNMTFKKSA